MANRSITTFRFHEREQRSNSSSIIRATNFDTRIYANDKNNPAEDEPDYTGLNDPTVFVTPCVPPLYGCWYSTGSGSPWVMMPFDPYTEHTFTTSPTYFVFASPTPFNRIEWQQRYMQGSTWGWYQGAWSVGLRGDLPGAAYVRTINDSTVGEAYQFNGVPPWYQSIRAKTKVAYEQWSPSGQNPNIPGYYQGHLKFNPLMKDSDGTAYAAWGKGARGIDGNGNLFYGGFTASLDKSYVMAFSGAGGHLWTLKHFGTATFFGLDYVT